MGREPVAALRRQPVGILKQKGGEKDSTDGADVVKVREASKKKRRKSEAKRRSCRYGMDIGYCLGDR